MLLDTYHATVSPPAAASQPPRLLFQRDPEMTPKPDRQGLVLAPSRAQHVSWDTAPKTTHRHCRPWISHHQQCGLSPPLIRKVGQASYQPRRCTRRWCVCNPSVRSGFCVCISVFEFEFGGVDYRLPTVDLPQLPEKSRAAPISAGRRSETVGR